MTTKHEQGIVSLTITVIIGILLSVIVISMIQIIIRVQRESTDGDLSTRAYFAAESGVEDALYALQAKIKAGTLRESDFTNVCGTEANLNNPVLVNQAIVTCTRLTHVTNQLTGTLERDGQPLQLDLGNTNFKKVVLRWNTAADCGGRGDGTCNNAGETGYSPPTNFTGTSAPGGLGINNWLYPAVPELISVSYPQSGSFNAGSISLDTTVIRPGVSGASSVHGTPVVDGNCAVTTLPYTCEMTLTGFSPSEAHVLRLKSRYAGMHYSLQFYNGLGAGAPPVNVPDQFATIDVTARSGDVFRRIIYKVRLASGAANVDYAIYSDTNICKNMSVSLGVATDFCP